MGLSLALTQPLSAALDETSVLVIPGWNGSGVGHWQTLWEQKYRRFHRVIQHNWTRPSRADWIVQIDAAWRRREVLSLSMLGGRVTSTWLRGMGFWPIGEELLRGFVARR